jgi:hypothetical protein
MSAVMPITKNSTGRDGGLFLALPHAVTKSKAYRSLGHTARSLLIDVAIQLNGKNNGQLLCSLNHLRDLGWKSADTVQRAKDDLLGSGLLYETAKGHSKGKASWFAVTWLPLPNHRGYDAGTFESFQQGCYRGVDGLEEVQAPRLKQNREALYARWSTSDSSNDRASEPTVGTEKNTSPVPSHGEVEGPTVPSHGMLDPIWGGVPVPSHGILSRCIPSKNMSTGQALCMACGDWVLPEPDADHLAAMGSTGLGLLN